MQTVDTLAEFQMDNSKPQKRTSGRPVTIREVARLAEVSLITVSRAFNSPEQLSAATLKKVREAIAQTGYVPNMTAGNLRSSRTRMIAVFVPQLSGLFEEMIRSLTDAFAARGYQVMLGQIGYSTLQETDLLRAVIGRRPDGIVLTGVMHSAEARELLARSGIPIVETWDLTPDPIDMLVSFSHEEISAEVCRYLARKGRKRIAVVGGNDPRSIRRNEVFLQTTRELGLEPAIIMPVPAPTNHASGRAALAALIEHHPAVDAVYCSSDTLAMGVLTEAQVRRIPVPDELAVIGSGNLDFAASLHPSLTTVQINGALVGTTAAQFIMNRLEEKEVPGKIVKLGFEIIERESA